MKIVIPMAGYGTRLRPHTWSKPKPLVSVAGKAVLGHVLDMFAHVPDVEEIIFIVGYLGEQAEAFMAEYYPETSTRFVLQEEMLGQSHALWLARDYLEGPICMVFVDTLIEADLSGLSKEPADAVAWLKAVDDPRRFGVAEVDEKGFVHRLIEKPKDMTNNLALVGFYYFKDAERLVRAIERQMEGGTKLGGEFYLADAINILLEQGLRMRAETVDVWKDCGKPDALLDTNRYLLDHDRDNTSEAARRDAAIIIPPVFIHPTAAISESVIGPHASIGPRCVIQRSVVSNSIVEAGALIQDTVLTVSIVGQEARVVGQPQRLNIGDHSAIDIP
jgi:glucose-1-phosphate thymidylyltransferase